MGIGQTLTLRVSRTVQETASGGYRNERQFTQEQRQSVT
jgi:hypothetical protein